MSTTPKFSANTEAAAANPTPIVPQQRTFAPRTPVLTSSQTAFPLPNITSEANREAFNKRAIDGKLNFKNTQLLLKDLFPANTDDSLIKQQASAIFQLSGINEDDGFVDYIQFESQIATKTTHPYDRDEQFFDHDVEFTQQMGRKKTRNDDYEESNKKNNDGDDEMMSLTEKKE